VTLTDPARECRWHVCRSSRRFPPSRIAQPDAANGARIHAFDNFRHDH
jgi:hypothetical protein